MRGMYFDKKNACILSLVLYQEKDWSLSLDFGNKAIYNIIFTKRSLTNVKHLVAPDACVVWQQRFLEN